MARGEGKGKNLRTGSMTQATHWDDQENKRKEQTDNTATE